jgi:predicted esterase
MPPHSRATLVGFHGYQENAAIHFDVLKHIAGDRPIGIVSIQGLHRFYTRATDVVASWMTKEDRETAIGDNVHYVDRVLHAVTEESGINRPLIYVGFSQGVAMAYRAAVLVQRPCDGVIALAGDVPPDVAPLAASLPRVLLGRGSEDQWYGADKAATDLELLNAAGVAATEVVFEGGHVWTPAFIARASEFLDQLLNKPV